MNDSTNLPGLSIADLGPKTMIQVALLLLENGTDAQKAQALAVLNGQPTPPAPQLPWQTAEEIADLPEIDEAIRGFLEDPTGDNGTGMVRKIIEVANARLTEYERVWSDFPSLHASLLRRGYPQAYALHLAGQLPDELREIGQLIRTQDNRITDQPMFIVQQLVEFACDPQRTSGFESTRYIWVKDSEEVDEVRSQRLEKHYNHSPYSEIPSGYERVCLGQTWEFVTACYTEQGCRNFIARDGHNLKEPRIMPSPDLRVYANGSYRNFEFRTIRDWLKSLPPPDEVQA